MMSRRICLLLLLIGSVSFIRSQTNDPNSGDFSLNVHGQGKRSISPPSKISELPEVKEEDHTKPLVSYAVLPKKVNVSFIPEPIKPARLKVREPLEKLYPGYLKAGFGNYVTPLVDFYYGGTRSRKNSWGLNLKHFSSAQGPDDVGFSGFSENAFGASYNHFLDYHTLSFDLKYNRDVAYYYGFDLTDSTFANFKDAKDDIRTTYNNINFSAQLESHYKDSAKLNHTVDLNYNFLMGNYQNRENRLVLGGRVQKYFGKELARLDFSLDYNDYMHQSYAALDSNQLVAELSENEFNVLQNSAILKVTPSINALRKNFKAHIGASMQVDSRSGGFHLFPHAEVKYSLFNDMFIPYAGATGNIDRNSFQSVTADNPFVSSAVQLKNTVQRYEIYGGIRGSFSSSMSFNMRVSHGRYTDMLFFYNDTLFSMQNKFDVVYDNANVLKVGGQLGYRAGERLKLYSRLDFYQYDMDVEAHAWHMPSLEISVGGVYNMADKLIIRADLFFIGQRHAKLLKEPSGQDLSEVISPDGNDVYYPVEMNAIFDGNLGLEYRLTKKVSAFVNVNNLTTKKYQMWLRYPNQSINILFGGTVRF